MCAHLNIERRIIFFRNVNGVYGEQYCTTFIDFSEGCTTECMLRKGEKTRELFQKTLNIKGCTVEYSGEKSKGYKVSMIVIREIS